MPLDAAILAILFGIIVLTCAVFIYRRPAAWRRYVGRFGLALGLAALAATYCERLITR